MSVVGSTRLRETHIDLRLASNPEAISAARHSLDEFKGLLPPEKLEDVRLVVSELVTNSVRHARLSHHDQISLTVTVSAGLGCGGGFEPGPGFVVASGAGARPDPRGGGGGSIV